MKNSIAFLFMLYATTVTCAEKPSVEIQPTPNELAKRFVDNVLELSANDNPAPFKQDIEAFNWHCSCNALANVLKTQVEYENSLEIIESRKTLDYASKLKLERALQNHDSSEFRSSLNPEAFNKNSIEEMAKAIQSIPTRPKDLKNRYITECMGPLSEAINSTEQSGYLHTPYGYLLNSKASKYKYPEEKVRVLESLAEFARERDECTKIR